MITLKTKTICDHCPLFEPEVQTKKVYSGVGDKKTVTYDRVIKCRQRHICDTIEAEMRKEFEEIDSKNFAHF